MKYFLLLTFVLITHLFHGAFINAQDNFDFYDPKTSFYVFGEEHYHISNVIFYDDAIRYLMKAAPEKDVVIYLEYPFIFTDMINDCLNEKPNLFNEALKIIRVQGRFFEHYINTVENQINIIKNIINENRSKDNVRVVCFNTFALGKNLYDALSILSMIYPELNQYLAENELFANKSKAHSDKIMLIDDVIKNIKPSDTSKLFAIGYKKPYGLTDCLKLLKFEYLTYPFSSSSSFHREFIMTQNVLNGLSSLLDINIIITGSDHAFRQDFVKFRDYTSTNGTFKSMTAMIVEDFLDENIELHNHFMMTFGMTYHSKRKLKNTKNKYADNIFSREHFFLRKQEPFKDSSSFDDYFDYRVYLRKSQPFKWFHGLKKL